MFEKQEFTTNHTNGNRLFVWKARFFATNQEQRTINKDQSSV